MVQAKPLQRRLQRRCVAGRGEVLGHVAVALRRHLAPCRHGLQQRFEHRLERGQKAHLGRKQLAELGDHEGLVAAPPDSAANLPLAIALTIDVGGVKDGDAEIERVRQDLADLRHGRGIVERADLAAAQTELGQRHRRTGGGVFEHARSH